MATKEEKFLVALFLMEQKVQMNDELKPIDAARSIGLSEKSMKNSINMLAQTNFLKKSGARVRLTLLGREFVKSFLKSS